MIYLQHFPHLVFSIFYSGCALSCFDGISRTRTTERSYILPTQHQNLSRKITRIETQKKKMHVFVATEGRLHVRYITVDNLGAGPFCVSLWHYVSVAQHMQHRRARSSNDDPAEPYSAAE